MLSFQEKVDFDARFNDIEEAVERWRECVEEASEEAVAEFRDKLIISLIYHDAALEGDVLTHGEIKAATDTSIITDPSLLPSLEEIQNFHGAIKSVYEAAGHTRKAFKLDTIRDLHMQLSPKDGVAYRKENPLHRLYYHSISPPEKITYRMRKFGEWLDGKTPKGVHPIERAAEMHHQLMGVFPWAKKTGRTARLASNLVLMRGGYPMAVIHSIDRQKYYESLRSDDHKNLLLLYLESVETTARSATRVYEAATKKKGKRRSKKRAS